MKNDKVLGEQIRKLRMSKKYTLALMADRLGVTTSAVASYENGSRNPSFDVLMKIARIFNVTVDTLLGGNDEDLINVSGLLPEQRDNVQNLISTYTQFNEAMDLLHKHEVYITEAPVIYLTPIQTENNEEKDDTNNEHNKVKDLEDRIKILEEIIKSQKNNE